MFDTPILSVAIGLVFCFAATALLLSTITELIASLLKLRSNTLLTGVKTMFNDPKFTGVALDIYNHALFHPTGDGTMSPRSRFWTYSGPSYVKAADFATAAIDVLQKVPGDMSQLKASIDGTPNAQLKQLLQGMASRANGDVEKLRNQLAAWFDSSMARVSGSYKRRAQLIGFITGLIVAVSLNIDAYGIATTLWRNPSLAKQLASDRTLASKDAKTDVGANWTALKEFPIGNTVFEKCVPPATPESLICGKAREISTYLGGLLTAIATIFGAPFWFDALQQLVQIRGSGPKPKVKTEKATP